MSSAFDSTSHRPEASQAIATSFLGPFYVGVCLNFVLYGMLVSNFAGYIVTRNYRRDSKFNKVFIWVVVTLDTLATGVNVFECYYHGVSQDRTAKSVLMTHPVDALSPALVGALGAVVESFLLLRASKLFRHQRVWRALFLGAGALLLVVGFIASIGCTVANLAFTYNFSDRLLPFTYNMLAGIWLWCSAAVDLLITVTLVIGMRRAIHGFNEDTDNSIRRIMRVAMLTASWTALFGALGALMSVVFPPTDSNTLDVNFAFSVPLASLYALSVLTTLSSRKPIRRTMALATPKVTQLSPDMADSAHPSPTTTLVSAGTAAGGGTKGLLGGPLHRTLDAVRAHASRSDSAASAMGHRRSASRSTVGSGTIGGITVTREVQSAVDISPTVSRLTTEQRVRKAHFDVEFERIRDRMRHQIDARERARSREASPSPSGKGILKQEEDWPREQAGEQ